MHYTAPHNIYLFLNSWNKVLSYNSTRFSSIESVCQYQVVSYTSAWSTPFILCWGGSNLDWLYLYGIGQPIYKVHMHKHSYIGWNHERISYINSAWTWLLKTSNFERHEIMTLSLAVWLMNWEMGWKACGILNILHQPSFLRSFFLSLHPFYSTKFPSVLRPNTYFHSIDSKVVQWMCALGIQYSFPMFALSFSFANSFLLKVQSMSTSG